MRLHKILSNEMTGKLHDYPLNDLKNSMIIQ